MKIRRKSAKLGSPDGVPPLHTLITCTYQKLFKRDGCFDNGAAGADPGGHGASPDRAVQRKRQKLHRHDLGRSSSWANGRRLRVGFDVASEAKAGEEEEEEGPRGNLGAGGDVEDHGDGGGRDTPHDLHDARTNPLLPKRRKVKSTRYADFTEETTPLITKSEKRSRNVERESLDTAEYINTVASSKEALIASIFFVFDTLGKSGLTASEVVAVMLEQALPGLKEGGARHTVQVANVLRRSRHFLSIGNKQYLPCSGADDKPGLRHPGQASKSKPACKLYDGSGWHCPRGSHPGFSLCVHHLDMINRPLGNLQAPTSPPHILPQHEAASHELEDRESDSDRDESEDIGPAKWGRDRTPGSAPSQKRKMLSLMSIK